MVKVIRSIRCSDRHGGGDILLNLRGGDGDDHENSIANDENMKQDPDIRRTEHRTNGVVNGATHKNGCRPNAMVNGFVNEFAYRERRASQY